MCSFWNSNPDVNTDQEKKQSLPESLHLGGGGLDARLHPVHRPALSQQLSSTFLHQVRAGVSTRGHYSQEMPVQKCNAYRENINFELSKSVGTLPRESYRKKFRIASVSQQLSLNLFY